MIVVDWSAANLPTSATNRANAVWIGCHDAEGGAEWHHRTRAAAEAQLVTLIDTARKAGLRLLVGFDFAMGYPAGFAARLTGEITAADAEALSAQLAQASLANMRQMQLDSIGGDLAAAFAIGRLMRKHQFDSLVLPDGQCDSACVFVLAAGIDKVVKGNVGIHRPYFSAISSEDVQTALQEVMADAEAYLTEMNIPTRLVEEMFSTDPAEMRNLTRPELEACRLHACAFPSPARRARAA